MKESIRCRFHKGEPESVEDQCGLCIVVFTVVINSKEGVDEKVNQEYLQELRT